MDTNNTTPLVQTGSINSINWAKIVIAVVGLAVFGGACAYVGHEIPVRQDYTPVLSNASTTKGSATPSVTASTMVSPTISPTPSVLPTPYSYPGWKTYTDSQDQVSFEYPSDWHNNVSSGAFILPNNESTSGAISLSINKDYTSIDAYLSYLRTPLQRTSGEDYRIAFTVTKVGQLMDNGRTYTVVTKDYDINGQGYAYSPGISYLFLTKSGTVADLEFGNVDPSLINQVVNTLSY